MPSQAGPKAVGFFSHGVRGTDRGSTSIQGAPSGVVSRWHLTHQCGFCDRASNWGPHRCDLPDDLTP